MTVLTLKTSVLLILVSSAAFVSSCSKKDKTGEGSKARPDPSRLQNDSSRAQDSAFFPVHLPKPIEEMTKNELIAFRDTLEKRGIYKCCIDPGCTTCLIENETPCVCASGLQKNDPVCGECYRGWKDGRGSVKGVRVEDVKRK